MATEIEWLERINEVDGASLDHLREGPVATALFDEIVRLHLDGPAQRMRRRRTRTSLLGAVAACLVALCVVLATGALQSKPAAAVIFAQKGNAVIVTIVDPMATAGDFSQAFAAHHLDISVRLIPVSPSEVGQIITQEGPGGATIRPVATEGCPIGDPSCPITVAISDVQGHSSVDIGRAAQPGESYASGASAFASGEVLHCSGLINAPAAEAESYLRSHDLSVVWRTNPLSNAGRGEPSSSTTSTTQPSPAQSTAGNDQGSTTSDATPQDTPEPSKVRSSPLPVDTSEYVVDGQAISSNEVMLFVSPTPAPAAEIQRLQGSC